MNKENLQRMADYIRTIPQEKFNMVAWRDGDTNKHECDSVGCVVGHCTVLDKIENIPFTSLGSIDFTRWSEDFTGIYTREEWNWCFSDEWHEVDNTPEGAALRIEWLLEKGLPEDWEEQMNSEVPLCYKSNNK